MSTESSHPVTRCLRCHRQIRSASSVSAGYGRWCRAKIRAAALAEAVKGFTAEQAEKARDLISDAGIVRTGRAGIWRTVSSRGDEFYLTHTDGCNCKAGLNGRRCYHTAAARILAASVKA
jgi:hypothetical protein